MDALFEYLLKAIAYAFNAFVHWLKVRGTSRWPFANATITAPPVSSSGFGCPSVEIVYSYRIEGELYTGIHEKPFLSTDAVKDYVERFGVGRSIIVRVKPSSPEVSVVCEGDQGVLIGAQLTS